MSQQVVIGIFQTRTEAEIVRGMLASAGIEAWVSADDAGGAAPLEMLGGARVLSGARASARRRQQLIAGREPG